MIIRKRIGNWRKIVLKMPLCLKKCARKRLCVFWNTLRAVCLRSWVRWPWYFITVPAGTRALPKRKICWQFWLGETIRMRCIALFVCWRLTLKALTTAVCQCLKGFFTVGLKVCKAERWFRLVSFQSRQSVASGLAQRILRSRRSSSIPAGSS